tara:strand:+ start:875 stop:1141 length:267 start_codon:yes stop_codon:yes gene_type:complete
MFFSISFAAAEIVPVRSNIAPTTYSIEYENTIKNFDGDCLAIFRINYEKVNQEISAGTQIYIWEPTTDQLYPANIFYTMIDPDTCRLN